MWHSACVLQWHMWTQKAGPFEKTAQAIWCTHEVEPWSQSFSKCVLHVCFLLGHLKRHKLSKPCVLQASIKWRVPTLADRTREGFLSKVRPVLNSKEFKLVGLLLWTECLTPKKSCSETPHPVPAWCYQKSRSVGDHLHVAKVNFSWMG